MQTQLPELTPEMVEMFRVMKASGLTTPKALLNATKVGLLDVVEHGESSFYIPETGKPIKYEQFQAIILRIAAGSHSYPRLKPFYSTIEYSTIKKSGKTALSGAYAKWRSESSTLNDEILFFANDETQSRGRAYAAIQKAIELNPLYDRQKRILYDTDGNAVWRIIEDYLEHIPTYTKVRAVNVDYRGEAGANPSLTVWTEAWGYDTQKQLDLWNEMTPVLTRERSQRFVEGYAGYIGKSKVLEKLENDVQKEGRQLTLDDIPDWPWQDEELLPFWVNDQAGIFAYIDRGDIARRRMYWLLGPKADEYYVEQAHTLTPDQYDRLHRNYWISPVTAFLPIEWFDACGVASSGASSSIAELKPWRQPVRIKEVPAYGDKDELGRSLLDLYMAPSNWEIVGTPVNVSMALDASVAGDCTGLTMCSRDPREGKHHDVVLRRAYKWDPPKNGKLDYDYTPCATTGLSLRQQIIKLCMEYNVVQLAYDEWQQHHMMNELRQAGIVWCYSFKQSTARDIADKQLYDLIRDKRLAYLVDNNGQAAEPELDLKAMREHIQNSARRQKAGEDTKAHIVKAREEGKIDLTVCLSMNTAECLRLDI